MRLAGIIKGSKNWSLEVVGAHFDHTADYDDINKETYSYFRRFTDSYILDVAVPQGWQYVSMGRAVLKKILGF